MKTDERQESTVTETGDAARIAAATASGLYCWSSSFSAKEEFRLDVDGHLPQMVASGVVTRQFMTAYWVASLTKTAENKYEGDIWYKFGQTSLIPHTRVVIDVTPSVLPYQRTAQVAFLGEGVLGVVRDFVGASDSFHTVEFEFDTVAGATLVADIDTHAHPNRPAGLPSENLTVDTVYRRSGFDVRRSGGDDVVPLDDAGSDAQWTNMEMHDAMQAYWSRFGNRPNWAMWVFTAALHIDGSGLGGIMFDDIGPNHRQGTAIFSDSFISNAPAGDPEKEAWVQRMRFWTTAHEMGHAFNLAHSWQKAHPAHWGTPWIPLDNEPNVRSFMNYPYNVPGGQTAFFSDFAYRFSDQELLFMRHAPGIFVQMGDAAWFDQHGFQQVISSPEPAFQLELRSNRDRQVFEFMEPPALELKLTNITNSPLLIEEGLLSSRERLTVIIKRDGKPARQYAAYSQACLEPKKVVVQPGTSLYESLAPASGLNGWDLADPGYYTIQVALNVDEQGTLVSNPLRVRIEPPHDFEEERLAQDFFSDSVGRILAMNGSQVLDDGNNTLREVVDRLGKRRAALHARVALACPLVTDYKLLDVRQPKGDALDSVTALGGRIRTSAAKIESAQELLAPAFVDDMNAAADTFGHVGLKNCVDGISNAMAAAGANEDAARLQSELHAVLAHRKVLKTVLKEIKKHEKRLRDAT